MSQNYKIGILNNWAYKKTKLYSPWIYELNAEVYPYKEYHINWLPTENLDLLITHLHYQEPEASILLNAISQNIPTLILSDGILEYRNTWDKPISPSTDGTIEYRGIEYPPLPPASVFQPVLGHKIAALGRSPTRLIESWGNIGKCEIVGLPRLDEYLTRSPRHRQVNEPFRILIMTARTPGFNQQQMKAVQESLQDLKSWLFANPKIDGLKIQPLWRLTQNLDEVIGVDSSIADDLTGAELASVLENVDAMITTPSTAMLEGMLQGIPVALLDYNNCPHFVPAAWRIAAPQHIEQVIPELINPPAPKMLYQDTILHDALECKTPAKNRMVQLVQSMIEIGRSCKENNQTLEFPMQILPDPQSGHHLPEKRFDLQQLYPDHPVFGNMDRTCLQVENGHLKLEVARLKQRLATTQAKRKEKSFYGKFRGKLSKLKHRLLSNFQKTE